MTTHSKIETPVNNSLTPLKAVRRHCVDCCCGNVAEPAQCSATGCPLWLFRFGRKPTPDEREVVAEVTLYPLERGEVGDDVAMRSALKSTAARCLDCAGSLKAVKECTRTDCDLHCYRLGKGNRTLSPEQKLRNVERLKRSRPRETKPKDDAR